MHSTWSGRLNVLQNACLCLIILQEAYAVIPNFDCYVGNGAGFIGEKTMVVCQTWDKIQGIGDVARAKRIVTALDGRTNHSFCRNALPEKREKPFCYINNFQMTDCTVVKKCQDEPKELINSHVLKAINTVWRATINTQCFFDEFREVLKTPYLPGLQQRGLEDCCSLVYSCQKPKNCPICKKCPISPATKPTARPICPRPRPCPTQRTTTASKTKTGKQAAGEMSCQKEQGISLLVLITITVMQSLIFLIILCAICICLRRSRKNAKPKPIPMNTLSTNVPLNNLQPRKTRRTDTCSVYSQRSQRKREPRNEIYQEPSLVEHYNVNGNDLPIHRHYATLSPEFGR